MATASRKAYEVYYVADLFNVHSVVHAPSRAVACRMAQRMMKEGEAYGFELAVRASPETIENTGKSDGGACPPG